MSTPNIFSSSNPNCRWVIGINCRPFPETPKFWQKLGWRGWGYIKNMVQHQEMRGWSRPGAQETQENACTGTHLELRGALFAKMSITQSVVFGLYFSSPPSYWAVMQLAWALLDSPGLSWALLGAVCLYFLFKGRIFGILALNIRRRTHRHL